ncbi:unnamed protein product, partial [Dovyalis caffra]
METTTTTVTSPTEVKMRKTERDGVSDGSTGSQSSSSGGDGGGEEGGFVCIQVGCIIWGRIRSGISSFECCTGVLDALRSLKVGIVPAVEFAVVVEKPIRKGVIGPTLMVEELGRRKVNHGDVYVVRFYNRLDETKKGE